MSMSDEEGWLEVKSLKKKKGKAPHYRPLPAELAEEARENPRKKEKLELCRHYGKKGVCGNPICSFPHTEGELTYWKFVMGELWRSPMRNELDFTPPEVSRKGDGSGTVSPKKTPTSHPLSFPPLSNFQKYAPMTVVATSEERKESGPSELSSFTLLLPMAAKLVHQFVAQKGGSIYPSQLEKGGPTSGEGSSDLLFEFISKFGSNYGLFNEDNRILSSCFSKISMLLKKSKGSVSFVELKEHFEGYSYGMEYVEECGGVPQFFRQFGDNYGVVVNENAEVIEFPGLSSPDKGKGNKEKEEEEEIPGGGAGGGGCPLSSLKCHMCHSSPRVVVFVKCGHLAVCEECGEKMKRPNGGYLCPVCWSESPGRVRVQF